MNRIRVSTKNRIAELISILGHEDSKFAKRAERSLVRHFGVLPIDALIEATESSDPQMRMRAAYILGKKKDRGALLALQKLTADDVDYVRYDASLALGELNDAQAITRLIKILQIADDSRYAAASGLAEMTGENAVYVVDALLRLLETTDDMIVLAMIANIFYSFQDSRTIPALRKLTIIGDDHVRSLAVEAIEAIEAVESVEATVGTPH